MAVSHLAFAGWATNHFTK